MKLIVSYLLFLGVIFTGLIIALLNPSVPIWILNHKLILQCALWGGIGGVIYCLRGVYLNACVKKSWDSDWVPWYYIRPIVSLLCGSVSYLFLRVGLLVLETQQDRAPSNLGFLALAFIAGFNVDKFIGKIEDVSQTIWGIEKSRTANREKE